MITFRDALNVYIRRKERVPQMVFPLIFLKATCKVNITFADHDFVTDNEAILYFKASHPATDARYYR